MPRTKITVDQYFRTATRRRDPFTAPRKCCTHMRRQGVIETARLAELTFSRPAHQRRNHHGQEEEEKERKEVIDPIGSFPPRQRRGNRWGGQADAVVFRHQQSRKRGRSLHRPFLLCSSCWRMTNCGLG